MNKIKNNKKLFAIILIISLLAVLLGSYAICKNSNKNETASKIEKSEKLEKKAEKKLKEAKKSGDKEEIAKAEKELKQAEEKTEEVKKSASSTSASSSSANKSKSTPTASKPSTSSSSANSSTSNPTSKPKEKQKVWIVDKAAWTETVYKAIYSEGRTVYRATTWDNSRSGTFYSYEEMNQWFGEDVGSYQIDTEGSEFIGYDTEVINHPEEGHWEYR